MDEIKTIKDIVIDPFYDDDYLYKSMEGICIHCSKGHNIRMKIVGTYDQLALHEVEEHYDVWKQVENAHGVRDKPKDNWMCIKCGQLHDYGGLSCDKCGWVRP